MASSPQVKSWGQDHHWSQALASAGADRRDRLRSAAGAAAILQVVDATAVAELASAAFTAATAATALLTVRNARSENRNARNALEAQTQPLVTDLRLDVANGQHSYVRDRSWGTASRAEPKATSQLAAK